MSKYECLICHYSTNVKCNYEKHLICEKHIQNEVLQNENKSKIDISTNNKSTTRECIYCKKIYANRHSLCVHLKKCKEKNNKYTNNELLEKIKDKLNDTEFIKQIITSLFSKKDILESLNISPHEIIQINNTTNNTMNNTTNNTINNQFDNRTINNLNLFFDTKCKNAMNISDFFNRLQVTNYDVENIDKNGFSTGIYEIIDEED